MGLHFIRRDTITDETEPTQAEHDYNLIITGTKAQELLDNPTFSATVNELSTQIINGLLATATSEFQKRQDLYMLHKALETITTLLKASASIKPIVEAQHIGVDEEEADLTDQINED